MVSVWVGKVTGVTKRAHSDMSAAIVN